MKGEKLSVMQYFRPALQYLNALGGGVLLDSLSENEIQEIIYSYIMRLKNGEEAVGIEVEVVDEEQEEDDLLNLGPSEEIQEFRDQFDEEKQRKKIGAKWKHKTLGIGVVLRVRDNYVDVQFEDGIVRTMG